jgi:hypothetical protein
VGNPGGSSDPDGSPRDIGALPTYKTPPQVLATRPQSDEQDVSAQTTIEAVFDIPLDPATITGDHVIVSGESGDRGGSITYEPRTRTITFHPDQPFQGGEIVSVLLTGEIASLWDQTLASDYSWSFQITTGTDVADADPDGLPVRFALQQNYPNPFNAETTIRFSLDQAGPVSLAVYNMLGQRVKVLYQGELEAGQHRASWNGSDRQGRPLASGVYFCRLEGGKRSEVRRMVLLK